MCSLWFFFSLLFFNHISNWLHLISPCPKAVNFVFFWKPGFVILRKRDKPFASVFFHCCVFCLEYCTLSTSKLQWCGKRMKLDTGIHFERILIPLWFQSQPEFGCETLCSQQLFWNPESLHSLSLILFFLMSFIWNWWLLSISQAAFPLNACNSLF